MLVEVIRGFPTKVVGNEAGLVVQVYWLELVAIDTAVSVICWPGQTVWDGETVMETGTLVPIVTEASAVLVHTPAEPL